MSLDTVDHAGQTPDLEQPWADLGLKEDLLRGIYAYSTFHT